MDFWQSLLTIIEQHGLMAIIAAVLMYLLHEERKQRESDNDKMRSTIDGLKDTMHENTLLMTSFKQLIEDKLLTK